MGPDPQFADNIHQQVEHDADSGVYFWAETQDAGQLDHRKGAKHPDGGAKRRTSAPLGAADHAPRPFGEVRVDPLKRMFHTRAHAPPPWNEDWLLEDLVLASSFENSGKT